MTMHEFTYQLKQIGHADPVFVKRAFEAFDTYVWILAGVDLLAIRTELLISGKISKILG